MTSNKYTQAELQAILDGLDADQLETLTNVSNSMKADNEKTALENAEIQTYITSYNKLTASIKGLVSKFKNNQKFDSILESANTFNSRIDKHIERLPEIDANVLKSQRIAASGNHSTRSAYVTVYGNSDLVASFYTNPSIANLDGLKVSGLRKAKGNFDVITYVEMTALLHPNKLIHGGSDKGLRGLLNSFNNRDRNIGGRRCFSKDISDKLNDRSATSAQVWTDADCQKITDDLTSYHRAEVQNDDVSVAVINRNLIQ
tara:strand:+ start:1202 stop:1978 length:777 start_codon:yes stop_codon:yes gene_type:complete